MVMTGAAIPRRVRPLVQVVGLVVLVAVVLRRVEWSAVDASFRGASAATLAAIAAATLAAMGLRLWKWQVQLRAMGLTAARPAAVARGFLLGVLLGAVTPLRLGELYRVAAATPGGAAEATARAAAGVVLDKGYELLVVLATLALGVVLMDMSFGICVSAAAITLALAWLVLGPERAAGVAAAGPVGRARATLAAAKRSLGPRDRLRLLAGTAGAHALNLAAGLAIWRVFGELSLADYAVRVPLVTLLNAAPITIGGFGLRELAAIELFGPVGYPAAAAAVSAAALFFAANVLPALALLPVVAALARRRP